MQNKQISNRGLSKWHISERLHNLQGKIHMKQLSLILLYALFPALVIIHWGGQLSILGRKLQPIKKNTKESVECSFLFESKKQPLLHIHRN